MTGRSRSHARGKWHRRGPAVGDRQPCGGGGRCRGWGAHCRHPPEHFPPAATPEILAEGTGLQNTPARPPPHPRAFSCRRVELAPGRDLHPSPQEFAEGRGILVPMEEEKVRAGVSGCKQFYISNK